MAKGFGSTRCSPLLRARGQIRAVVHLAWLGAVLGSVAAGSAIAGCERATPGAAGQQDPGVSVRDAASNESPIAQFEARASAQGLDVIAAAADGRVLSGRAQAVPDRSSARLVYDEATMHDERGGSITTALPSRLQDARFAPPPSRRLAVLDDRDVLWLYEPPYDSGRALDQGVFPGFAFSRAGRRLAYARGQAPELYAFVLDLADGTRTQLTDHGNPVWGFAFSPDDRRIAFVDSREGFPSLMSVALDGGSPVKLTNRAVTSPQGLAGKLAPFPEGRRPPLWTSTGLWVEDPRGVHAIDRDGNVLVTREGARDLHRGADPDAVLFREGDRMRRAP